MVLCESLAKLSATAGARAAQLKSLSREVQRAQQLESQLAKCRGAAVAESRDVQEQLASLRAALRSQEERLGLQFKDTAAAAVSESRLLQHWSGELQALQAATGQALAA